MISGFSAALNQLYTKELVDIEPILPAGCSIPNYLRNHEDGEIIACAQIAQRLMEAGKHEPSLRLYDLMRHQFPGESIGWVGAAAVEATRGNWQAAIDHWDLAFRKFPIAAKTSWYLDLSNAYLELGQRERAITILQSALSQFPENFSIRRILSKLMEDRGDLNIALELLTDRLELCLEHPQTQFELLKLMSRRGRNHEASQLALRLIHSAENFDPLPGIVRMMPEICEGEFFVRCLDAAQGKLTELLKQDAIGANQRPLANELRLRLLALQRTLPGLASCLEALTPADLPANAHATWSNYLSALRQDFRGTVASPKLFGIGLSKTATSSLTVALEHLGLRSAHYQNPLTSEILNAEQCRHFDGCFDTPISNIFETLYYAFPKSRFLYTIRPIPNWLESLRNHHRNHFGTSDWDELRALTARGVSPSAMTEAALFFNHGDALSAWHAHDTRVRRFFADKPRDRFMIFDVFAGHGWAELCDFLDLPVPKLPFPHENKVR